jgi:hypothetical protein
MLSSFQHLWTHRVLGCLHTFKQNCELFISASLGSSARHLYTVVCFLKPVGESNLETLRHDKKLHNPGLFRLSSSSITGRSLRCQKTCGNKSGWNLVGYLIKSQSTHDEWGYPTARLVTDGPVEFEKYPVQVRDFKWIANHCRAVYRICLKPIINQKRNRKVSSTCNWLDFETLGSRLILH